VFRRTCSQWLNFNSKPAANRQHTGMSFVLGGTKYQKLPKTFLVVFGTGGLTLTLSLTINNTCEVYAEFYVSTEFCGST